MTRRALQIVTAALELPEPQRSEWARSQCANDEVLQGLVAKLLIADQANEPLIDSFAEVQAADDRRVGTRIGRYRIVARIGTGGMGVVYRADPEDGVARLPVALKLIKRGMDSEDILRRFVREREILARLEHPNITRLLDGGVTDNGRPWFALELVDGEPLLGYCDRLRLDIDARIDLFMQVCAAVEYAHRNLVIHRDLKPGNVLVTRDGLVKLLDFGIAKLIDTGQAHTTHSRARVMTPEYAAPEQVSGGAITTQTDVYQLGVLLAELLSGERPAGAGQQADAPGSGQVRLNAAFAARRATIDPEVLALAANRGSSVGGLARVLSGDLDRIVRQATSVETQRRYLSVSALGEDLRRYRGGLAVLASGDSLGYLTRTFLRRHRMAVIAVAAVLLAVAAGMVGTLREAERLRVALGHSALMQSLLTEVFLGADPYAAKAGDTRASDLLLLAKQKLGREERLPPALTAGLWYSMGQAYVSLDDPAPAIDALTRAAAASRLALACAGVDCVGSDPVRLKIIAAGSRARLAQYALREQPPRADALADLEQAAEDLKRMGEPAFAELSKVLQLVGEQDFNRGDYSRLIALTGEIVDLARRSSSEPSNDLLMALAYRSSVLRAIGEHRLALEVAESANALMRVLGPGVTEYMHLLVEQKHGAALAANGQAAAAEPLLESALQRAVALRGERSTLAIGLAWDVALTQSELGKHALAIERYRSLLAIADNQPSAKLAALHNALGRALLGLGDAAGASKALGLAESIVCTTQELSLPCALIKLNLADAEQAQHQKTTSRGLLDATEAIALSTGGRIALRWQLLASRQAISENAPARAEAHLQAAKVLVPTTAGLTSADRLMAMQVESEVLELRGDLTSASLRLAEAEQVCLRERPDDLALLERIRAVATRVRRH